MPSTAVPYIDRIVLAMRSIAAESVPRSAACRRSKGLPSRQPPTNHLNVSWGCFRRLDVDLRAFANLIGATADNRVAVLQRAEHLDEVTDTSTATDIHPLSDTVVHTDHKHPLGGGHDARRRYQQRRLRTPDRPLNLRIHS